MPAPSSLFRPGPDEYPEALHDYVDRVPESDILAVLAEQATTLQGLPARVGPERETWAYAPGKWSFRELVGHLGDGERAFAFRAFAFSRGETAALPGFDEDRYVANSPFAEIPLPALVDELVLLRRASLHMFAGFGAAHWARAGIANEHRVTVRALAWSMAGHVRHHLWVLAERYGIPLGS